MRYIFGKEYLQCQKRHKVQLIGKKIQQWVEERGGHPARVKGTESKNSAGLLRIDYPGFSGEDSLEEISWEEFFDGFEKKGVAFLYQDKTADGKSQPFL